MSRRIVSAASTRESLFHVLRPLLKWIALFVAAFHASASLAQVEATEPGEGARLGAASDRTGASPYDGASGSRRRSGPGEGEIGPGGGPASAGRDEAPGYSLQWLPSARVQESNARVGILKQSLAFGLPVWRSEGDALMLQARVADLQTGAGVYLQDSNRPFPQQLWNVGFGGMYSHSFDNGWRGMVMLNIGSASDRPFESLRTTNFTTMAMLHIPSGDRDSWQLGVMYSPVGQLPYPIPIVGYRWRPTDDFDMNVGIPFSLRWKPSSEVVVDASYAPLTNIETNVRWRPGDDSPLQAYGRFRWGSDAWKLHDQSDSSDNFYYDSKTLSTGIQWKTGKLGSIELEAGYSFDRRFYMGSQFGSASRDVNHLSATPYIGAAWRIAF